MAGRTYDFNKIKNEISGNTNFMQPKAPKYVPPKNTQVGNMLNTLKQNQNKPPQMRQISSPMMPQQKPNFSNVINTINKAQNPFLMGVRTLKIECSSAGSKAGIQTVNSVGKAWRRN